MQPSPAARAPACRIRGSRAVSSNGSVFIYLSFHLSIYLFICRLPTPPRLERESSKRSPCLRPAHLRGQYAAHELYRAKRSSLSIRLSIYLSICRVLAPPCLHSESLKPSPRLRPTHLRGEYAAHELYRATDRIYRSIYLSIYLSICSVPTPPRLDSESSK